MKLWPFSKKPTTSLVAARAGQAPEEPASALRARQARILQARYDAAQTTEENKLHWSFADGLSADAALMPWTRQVLRNRSRYEVTNNSYAKGVQLTLANDTIGTGPRLQLLTESPKDNQRVEQSFARWCKAVKLKAKLRTMRMSRLQDGEAFALMATNPALPTPVKLDLRLLEADQVATPFSTLLAPLAYDGIIFDEFGNPAEYHVLKAHPGGMKVWLYGLQYDKVPAASMIHQFRRERPGQVRGCPEIVPALGLFAQLRRYTAAVLGAAETAADIAAVLQTEMPPGGESEAANPWETMQIEKRSIMSLPAGWKIGQFDAKQPLTTMPDFVKVILAEIFRCILMPMNVGTGDSSDHNYASGRLDHQTYWKAIRIEQDEIGDGTLDPLLRAYLDEAALISGELPQSFRTRDLELPPHRWFWDGMEHVDPVKEATAAQTRLQNNMTTLADEYARQGQDWEERLAQRGREYDRMKELGLPVAPLGPILVPPPDGVGTPAPASQEADA